MKKIITLLILVTIAGAILIGMAAADNTYTISTQQVPAVEAGHLTTQEVIQ